MLAGNKCHQALYGVFFIPGDQDGGRVLNDLVFLLYCFTEINKIKMKVQIYKIRPIANSFSLVQPQFILS